MKNKIEKLLLMYGFLPMLLVLEHFQSEEAFEICEMIISAIEDYEKKYDIKLPREYNNAAIWEYSNVFTETFGLTGDVAIDNGHFYAKEIYDEIINT